MANHARKQTLSFKQTLRKLFLSAFVIITFIAYAIHRSLTGSDLSANQVLPAPVRAVAQLEDPPTQAGIQGSATVSQQNNTPTPGAVAQQVAQDPPASPQPTDPAVAAATDAPTQAIAPTDTLPAPTIAAPTQAPAPTATAPAPAVAASNGLKDGTYTGAEADALYGLVQVKTVIQNGKIADVQFLEFPQDRRTSQRINSVAVPDLQQEAIQAQSANVDLVSGATLTSQAFIQSLQSALDQARS
jgi:uncharacterized protein with FMN-binding domain